MMGGAVAGGGSDAGVISGDFAVTEAVGAGTVGVAGPAVGIRAAIVPALVPRGTEVPFG